MTVTRPGLSLGKDCEGLSILKDYRPTSLFRLALRSEEQLLKL